MREEYSSLTKMYNTFGVETNASQSHQLCVGKPPTSHIGSMSEGDFWA